jgi:hypothetical protein
MSGSLGRMPLLEELNINSHGGFAGSVVESAFGGDSILIDE